MEVKEKKLKLNDFDLIELLNYDESYLRLFDNRFSSVITLRGNSLIVKGDTDEIRLIEMIFKELAYMLRRNGNLKVEEVNSVIEILDDKKIETKKTNKGSTIFWGLKEPIKARNSKQRDYFAKVSENDLVFSIGPAGTGKTFLAVAMALAELKSNRVGRIIISRPAVEAGESLGFLPGDLAEKLDPYLRPITDALFYMIGAEKLKSMMEKNIIEITPLAYMRGRTLNNSFVVLDEAQNATVSQMKMFLTRMGTNSKAIVTGDITQIDLKDKHNSGLVDAAKILKGIKGIEFVYFEKSDVVRHHLVSKIINAYEQNGFAPKKSE